MSISSGITEGYMRAESERERELYEVANFADRAWKVRREFARDLVCHWQVSYETYAAMMRSGQRFIAHTTSPYDVVYRDGNGPELQLFGIRVERKSGVGRADLFLVVTA